MFVLTASYYIVIILLYYRRELLRIIRGRPFSFLLLMTTAIIYQGDLYAQTADGNNGLSQANTMVRSYFDTAVQLMYAVGAIAGLIGAVRIVTRRHREDMGGEIAIWFGSCIFLVVVATVLKSFYGL